MKTSVKHFIVFLFFMIPYLTVYGEYKEYNKIPYSSFEDKTPMEVFEKSNHIGYRRYLKHDIKGLVMPEVRKYKDESKELYLIEFTHEYSASDPLRGFIVVPRAKIDEYIAIIDKMIEVLNKSKEPDNGLFRENAMFYWITEDSYKPYEIITIDTSSGSSALYGVALTETIYDIDDGEIRNVYKIGNIDGFPRFIYNGEFRDLDTKNPKDLEYVKDLLLESIESNDKTANPETIERLGTYTYRVPFSSDQTASNEVLRFKKNGSSIYYIEINNGDVVDGTYCRKYLWMTKENAIKLRSLLEEVLSVLPQYESVSQEKLKKKLKNKIRFNPAEKIEFGGIISGSFDPYPKILKGKSLSGSPLYTYITLAGLEKYGYYSELFVLIGDESFTIRNSHDLKELVDALGK